MTLDQVKTQYGMKSLQQIADMFRHGEISRVTAELYCELWNTSTFRFTQAEVIGNSIIQREKE